MQCNKIKEGIPNLIFATKEVPYKTSLKEKRKDKYKMTIMQNIKNTNAKIGFLELFETFEEHRLALFELLSGIDVDIDISTSSLVGMIDYFKNGIIFIEDDILINDILDKCFQIHIHVKLLGTIVKHVFVDGGACLNT